MPVSLFINPSIKDVEMAKETGARMVEIHTGLYANAKGKRQSTELERVKRAVERASDIGLIVNAGHGLDYKNVQAIAGIEGIRGLYIGHGIISRSIFIGIEKAVREMKRLIESDK